MSGYITDESSGAGLNLATVQINSTPVKTTTTNATGYYNFSGLLNGTYIINASLTGYITNSTTRTVNGADITDANIQLSQVLLFVPPAPINLASTRGNFWVNNTWQAGTGFITDSYNVSVNGLWTNGTTATYYNSTVGAHNWSNITVYAYNNTGIGSLSSNPATLSTQVANNVPVMAQIGDRAVTAGEILTFTVSATDADSDPITYATNATKGSLNPTTGAYTWTTIPSDAGTYHWEFNSTDNYGGVAKETITVTVLPDTTPPVWSPVPSNQVVEFGSAFSYIVHATDLQAVTYSINDTANFAINPASGLITNATALSAGKYGLNITATDASSNANSTIITVTVQDTVAPVWSPVPSNQVVEFGSAFSYTVHATDLQAVTYSINDTTNFAVNPSTGEITNAISLNRGVYGLIVTATDASSNSNPATITVTVQDTTPPASVKDLVNVSYAANYINWTWTDPSDPDFDHVDVYLGGIYKGDVLKGMRYYNTSVSPGTYTIGTKTVDATGNVNATMVTNTAVTVLPLVRYINGTVMDNVTKVGIAGAPVSTNSLYTVTNSTGFYSFAVADGNYQLTARVEPTYYTNSSVTVSTSGSAVVVQDIELAQKPTGTITGGVTNG